MIEAEYLAAPSITCPSLPTMSPTENKWPMIEEAYFSPRVSTFRRLQAVDCKFGRFWIGITQGFVGIEGIIPLQ